MNVTVWLPALHMGAMHPYEKALTLFLAFAPFVVLAAVIVVRRRQDHQDHQDDHDVDEDVDRADETTQRDK